MTPENQKYFETYLDLFVTPGWKQFQEEMKEVFGSLQLDFANDYESFIRMKSAREQLSRIINFEAYIRMAMDNENADEKEAQDEGDNS